jgi:hypothetical protein
VGSRRLIGIKPMCSFLPPLDLIACMGGSSYSWALSMLDKPVLCPRDFPALVPSCETSLACHDFCHVEFIADSIHRHPLTFPLCCDCFHGVGSSAGGLGGTACGCLIGKRELAPLSPCFLFICLVSPVALPQLSFHCCRVPQLRLKPHSHPFFACYVPTLSESSLVCCVPQRRLKPPHPPKCSKLNPFFSCSVPNPSDSSLVCHVVVVVFYSVI